MKTALDTQQILDKLETQHPDADTELVFTTPFELLVATILSAQSTDQGVNRVTPALFKRYPDATTLSQAEPSELEAQIHATGFFRQKARALIGMATALVAEHGGKVPASMEALTQLPGVGRKTANVVLGHALDVPGLPVDRHVLRVSNRIGIADGADPVLVEAQLTGAMPKERWTRTSDTLILHGRRVCKPAPLCADCVVTAECDYFQSLTSIDVRHRKTATRTGPKAAHLAAKTPAKPRTRRATPPLRQVTPGGARNATTKPAPRKRR